MRLHKRTKCFAKDNKADNCMSLFLSSGLLNEAHMKCVSEPSASWRLHGFTSCQLLITKAIGSWRALFTAAANGCLSLRHHITITKHVYLQDFHHTKTNVCHFFAFVQKMSKYLHSNTTEPHLILPVLILWTGVIYLWFLGWFQQTTSKCSALNVL